MSEPDEQRQLEPQAPIEEPQAPIETTVEAAHEPPSLVAFQHEETTITVGPLPAPEILAKYEEACSGAADRIISMAESQSAHRQAMESKVVDANCAAQRHGPAYGFTIVMAAMVIAGILLWNGKETAGITTLISALAAIVITFVVGKSRQQSELKKSKLRDYGKPKERPAGDATQDPPAKTTNAYRRNQ